MATAGFAQGPGAYGANTEGALLRPFEGVWPLIHETAWIAPGAVVIGDVVIGPDSGIWFGCVLRGDVNEIRVGARSNIQDGTVLHVATHGQGAYVGDDVSIGHQALIHACTIGDGAFIGMKSCVMDNCTVEGGGFVGAGALVTPGKTVGSGEVWAGAPARMIRAVRDSDREMVAWTAPHYARLAKRHQASMKADERGE
ncbi:MAG: gamma carbonic anhydrase family protein [Alphaproteobacteria bacterium]|nr:gamma carbonic anhydrase family protein [Alphaproteobacteria bacterium]